MFCSVLCVLISIDLYWIYVLLCMAYTGLYCFGIGMYHCSLYVLIGICCICLCV